MIVGTAGHIDHGKTTLVRALTGVDTDRLPEERRRGISIELGYAYQPLADGAVLGYIDVPGHEKLVHTMLAGASGIDYALLVVAADDGVMPQTREHLAILELLGVAAGAVALTKIDRVAPAQRALVAAQVRAELAGSRLHAAPLYEVNATAPGDAGLALLRAELARAAQAAAARPSDGLFRLAIDRVFTLAGRGTVVAGTVVAGRLAVGEPVAILPAGTVTRARSIHAHNCIALEARAGERCALNLAGVELEAVHRGDWLADPAALAPSARLDARLELLPTAPLPLRSWAPLHLHWGTAHRVAHVVLLEHELLRPGERGRVQFVFEAPACAAPGDRFIVRNPQASQTLGGGVLLDPLAPARRRRSPARLARLAALEALVAGAGLGALLEAAPFGLSLAELVRLTGRPAAALAPPDGVRTVGAGQAPDARFMIRDRAWDGLKAGALAALAEFHASRPDEPGPDRARLQRIAAPGSPAALWTAAIEELLRAGSVVRSGAWLQLPAHRATLSARDGALLARLAPRVIAGRYDPPWVRELAADSGEPEERIRQLLAALARDGRAFQIVRDLYYDRDVLAELAQVVAALAGEHGEVEAARFRDAVGLGRKRAIQILEFFDRVGYTRRVGNAHRVRPDSGWLAPP